MVCVICLISYTILHLIKYTFDSLTNTHKRITQNKIYFILHTEFMKMMPMAYQMAAEHHDKQNDSAVENGKGKDENE